MKKILLLATAFLALGASRSFAEAEGPGGGGGGGGGGSYPQPAPAPANCTPWSWGSYSDHYRSFSTAEEAMKHCFCPDAVTSVYDAWYHRYVFMCQKPDDGGNGQG